MLLAPAETIKDWSDAGLVKVAVQIMPAGQYVFSCKGDENWTSFRCMSALMVVMQ